MFVGWFAFGYVTVGFLSTLGFSVERRQVVAYLLGLGLLAIALEAVWRRPVAPDPVAEASVKAHRLGRSGQNVLLSLSAVSLWGLWVARAMPGFWLVLVVIGLPVATENRIRAGADAAMGYPRFGMLDLLKLLSGVLVGVSDRTRLVKPRRHFFASSLSSCSDPRRRGSGCALQIA